MTKLELNEQAYAIAYAYGRNSDEYKEFCEENEIEFVKMYSSYDEGFEVDDTFVTDIAVAKAKTIIESLKNQDLFYYQYTHYHTDFNKGWYSEKNQKAWTELEALRKTTNLDWLMNDYEHWSRWEMKYEAKYVTEA